MSTPTAATPRATNPVYGFVQAFVGLFAPLPLLRLARRWLTGPSGGFRGVLLFGIAGLWFLMLAGMFMTFATKGFPPFKEPPVLSPLTAGVMVKAILRGCMGVLQLQIMMMFVNWIFFKSFNSISPDLETLDRGVKRHVAFERGIISLLGTLFTIGLSVLPLSALLVALPVVSPNEAVLSESVRPTKSRVRRLARRALAALAGLTVLVALLAFSIEVVSQLPLPPSGQLAALAKKILGTAVVNYIPDDEQPADLPTGKAWLTPKELLEKRDALREAGSRPGQKPLEIQEAINNLGAVEDEVEERRAKSAKLKVMTNPVLSPWLAKPIWTILPPVLVNHWPFVFLLVYATDLALLLLIGRVPLAYNFRYLWVRKRDTALTALAFTVWSHS